MTYTSHSDAICFASSSLSFFSPLLKRTFSSNTAEPGAVSTPASQSFLSGTGLPNNSDSREATGASENSSAYTPSSGRPRCEVRNTFAPFSSASLMVGSDARMRASLVTLPSSTGTFRSSRIRTRLPRRSWSAMRSTFMTRPSGGFRPGDRGVEHAVGEAPLVVVPGAHLDQRAFADARHGRIVGGRRRIMVVVDRDQLLLGVREHALHGAFGGFPDDLVDLFDRGRPLGDERQVDQRDVDRRDAHGKTIEFALELRQHQADRGRRSGLRRDHRHGGRTRA